MTVPIQPISFIPAKAFSWMGPLCPPMNPLTCRTLGPTGKQAEQPSDNGAIPFQPSQKGSMSITGVKPK